MNPFTEALRAVWQANGSPTLRAIALRTGGRVSHTSVGHALTGKTLPRWNTCSVLITVLRGDPEVLRPLWEQENERREARRREEGVTRRWRIARGLVVQPGDRILVTVMEDTEAEELGELQQSLSQEFPHNTVTVVGGVTVALFPAERSAA